MNDEKWMEFAFQLAKQAIGQTSPNPLVGAVVVKDGELIGFGAHLKAGEPHAEVHALNMAGEKAKGATLYVTLEPCSHFGKTPPCSELIIKRGIKRVVVAALDPNPLVSGRGVKALQDAGIDVEAGILQKNGHELNKVFFHYIQTNTPFVTLKYAATFDGKIATKTGDSKWITGEEARQDVHRYREIHDGILVGVNTIIKDNPSLTCRLPDRKRTPIRIILDTHLRIPLDANVITDKEAETWVICQDGDLNKKAELKKLGIEVLTLHDQWNIPNILKILGERGITSLFVEGGARVHASFLKAEAVNELIVYFAPKILGDPEGISAVMGDEALKMSMAHSFEIKSVTKIGEDVKIVSVPKRGGQDCLLESLKK